VVRSVNFEAKEDLFQSGIFPPLSNFCGQQLFFLTSLISQGSLCLLFVSWRILDSGTSQRRRVKLFSHLLIDVGILLRIPPFG
jgi:hypothetical protein